MGLELHPEISSAEMNERSIEMLELVGLNEGVNYYPDNLSGGQNNEWQLPAHW